ncbi:MAG: apolipoprotein N-acyltransferase [Desulfovibrionaceae bacterium]|nr:apolipoprotein N-acyltransferase [Desulfovibrionaceae bacterium]
MTFLLPFLSILGAWTGFANPVLAQLPAAALLLPAGLAAYAARAATTRCAFFGGWLAGTLAAAGCLYWIALPVHDYGHLGWWLAGACPVALGAYVGLYAGLYCLAARWGARRLGPLGAGLFAGTSWALLEWVRGWAFTGFPWLALPASLAPWPRAIAVLNLVGEHGTTFLLATAACWLVLGLFPPRVGGAVQADRTGRTGRSGHLRRPLAAALALAVLVVGYGQTDLSAPPPEDGRFVAALVQGNVDQSLKWDPAFVAGTIDRYRTLTEGALERGAQFAVWPETAMPFYLQEVNGESAAVRETARLANIPVLTGAPGYRLNTGDGTYLLYNRAYLLDSQGRTAGTYDKEHLVPFGEYVPLGEYLPFLTKLAEGAGDFVPGTAERPLAVRAGGPAGADLALGVLICYETIFTDLAQKRVENGANVLVNISNDAWFGRSSAPVQHLHLSVLRAMEQGRWLLRGTNTGISAFIAPTGRIAARGGLFRVQTVVREAAVISGHTVYHRVHDFVVPALWVLWAAFAAAAPRRRA